jgi:hypothetical protein
MQNAPVNRITPDAGSPQGPDWPEHPTRAALNTRSTTTAGRTSQGQPLPETARSTPLPQEDTMRKLIISLAAAAAITAAAAPALAQPAHSHAPAHVAAIVWHPGGCGGCHNRG